MKIKHLFIAISILFLTLSCSSHKDILTQSVDQTSERIVQVFVHDTVFLTEVDSSSFIGELEVDSLGNVTVKPLKSIKGNHISAPKLKVKNNIITIDCKAEAQELFYEWKETFIENDYKHHYPRNRERPYVVSNHLDMVRVGIYYCSSAIVNRALFF